MDDAGVVRVSDDLALVQTIDVFPPVVDDPWWFGRIAAANSLSDVYAMGGVPVSAVNFVGYPLEELGGEILRAMLEGAFDALREADCAMAGGHSIKDAEVKFGLAVVGTIHPDRILRNSSARAGDHLILTKPLGVGLVTTALKSGEATPEAVDAAQRCMGRLNRKAAEAMVRIGANACTDITGYGLVGHALEMAEGAGLSFHIRAADLPVLEEARPYLDARHVCGGSKRNESYARNRVQIPARVAEYERILLHDVQTSGGLLIAVPADASERLMQELRMGGDEQAAVIGEILASGPPLVIE